MGVWSRFCFPGIGCWLRVTYFAVVADPVLLLACHINDTNDDDNITRVGHTSLLWSLGPILGRTPLLFIDRIKVERDRVLNDFLYFYY